MMDGWMPSVGSSKSSRRGLEINARANANNCCSPPLSAPPCRAIKGFKRGNISSASSALILFAGFALAEKFRLSSTDKPGKIPRPCGTYPTPMRARMWDGDRVISACAKLTDRSEEHTSELQSLMRISYAVFCLKQKKQKNVQ